MGSWDEFNLAIELRKDTPKAVIDILDLLINGDRSAEIIVEQVSVPVGYQCYNVIHGLLVVLEGVIRYFSFTTKALSLPHFSEDIALRKEGELQRTL
jgi:hypothetical protein